VAAGLMNQRVEHKDKSNLAKHLEEKEEEEEKTSHL
jgi:hypothetical protein